MRTPEATMDPTSPVTDLERRLREHLHNTCVIRPEQATPRHVFHALAHAVRDLLVDRWHRTDAAHRRTDAKQIHYLSAEFLLGRALSQNLISLGVYDDARAVLAARGIDLVEILEQEPDPGLGNGGLGRLAACFLESMATLGLAGFGQGIRYQYGIFEQRIHEGQQVEVGDDWLRYGNSWEVARPDERQVVRFYGHVEHHTDENGKFYARWVDTKRVVGVPYDMPIAGFATPHVNTLRLWSAEPTEGFDLAVFNAGDFRHAVEERTLVEAISKVLYPADHTPEGRELRLKQQAFFCSCAIGDILRRFEQRHTDLRRLPEKVAIQLNDTHPAVTVAELMRVLVDERGLSWDIAWEITNGCVAYTNHTLMPEALETWPSSMFGRLLPRHLEIIREIDRRFRNELRVRWPREPDRIAKNAIVDDSADGRVHMAHLATVGSRRVNGVAALHSDLVRSHLLPDFATLWPDRFVNQTNGVTPRRWVLAANPGLADLLDRELGPRWAVDPEAVRGLEAKLSPSLIAELGGIKLKNKERLARLIQERVRVQVDPSAMFDVQIKRIHEYKRQLLCALYVVSRWLRLKSGEDLPPRVVLFAGKAAPGYAAAKQHIRFIHDIARLIERDGDCRGRLHVVFIPNYSVSSAEILIPAADLSEQISLAGKEASGTGNMKLAMNGALTIGTLDGANIEIRDAVGQENFFLFGQTAEQVEATRAQGYRPREYIARDETLSEVLALVASGLFSEGDPDRYRGLVNGLREVDTWMICADFADYERAQNEVDALWLDPDGWNRRAALNIARTGWFSSDRAIQGYARTIWNAEPVDLS